MIKKIVSIENLRKITFRLKRKGKKIVLCHGVFDLLHIGHINHFQEAKECGDVLIVTVTSDQYVHKGPNRPAFQEQSRLQALAALKVVDYVTLNNKPTAVSAIKELKPNIYCKGPDYKFHKNDITGEIKNEIEALKKVDGKIFFTKGDTFSSSNLINRFSQTHSSEQKSILTKIKKQYSFSTIRKFIENFKKLKVLIIGETIIDQYVFCDVLGKSGKEPVLVLRDLKTEQYLGGAAAVSKHISTFCKKITLLSMVGENCEFLKEIKKGLPKNVKFEYLKKKNSPTILKKRLLKEISGNNKFNINVCEPFNELRIEFLNDFSNALKKQKKIYSYSNLIYLIFWCAKKKIANLAKDFKSNQIRLGRGLIFHICPSNVPTNFIYSFFFGLLSGNSNIIKIPSKDSPEKKIIISTIKLLFKKKKFLDLKNSNLFIQYKSHAENTKKISSVCDGRVIWGGDQTINEIRKVWKPERAIEIAFADRYSLSVINLHQLKKLKLKEISLLAKRFYYDGYSMNQLACNSPHFVFWVGKKNTKLQNYFWNQVSQIADKKFLFDDIHIVDKYMNLIDNIITQDDFKNLKTFKNNLYLIDPSNKTSQIENIRGMNGTFFQKNINEIEKLKKYITKKCQTLSYFGFNKEKLKPFLLNNNLFGIDRIVPIGQALEIDIVWDGYDVINFLSRVISLK